MKTDYSDILSLGKKPKWFDGQGVPRFKKFHPDMLSCYADEIYCGKAYCQRCSKTFKVAFTLQEAQSNTIAYSYGDPPYHNCVGDSMTSIFNLDKKYVKQKDFTWKKKKYKQT